MKFMSYTLAAVAGLCFISGLFVLSSEGVVEDGSTRNVFRHV